MGTSDFGLEEIKMNEVKVLENNGGMITAVVINNNTVANVVSGFENSLIKGKEFVTMAQKAFPYSDPFAPYEWGGHTMEEIYSEENENSELIAEISSCAVTLYPEVMGIAAKQLLLS